MIVMLGSEWCHNLSHAFSAKVVGKSMDQMKIQMGMPRCVYYELNDQDVTPRQHIVRSLGGPIFNMLMVPIFAILRSITIPRSIARETADTALKTNLFLSFVSLLPIPGIDGGPILKWSLVEKGYELKEADEIVRKTNGPLSVILGLFSSWAFARKKILAGFFSLMLGLISLSIFTGWLKEEDVGI
jgi:Zn-dependent protease